MIGVNEREGDILDQNDGEQRHPKFIRNKIFFFVYHLINTEKKAIQIVLKMTIIENEYVRLFFSLIVFSFYLTKIQRNDYKQDVG